MAKQPKNAQNKILIIILSGLGLIALIIIFALGKLIYQKLDMSPPAKITPLPSFSSPVPTETLQPDLATEIPPTPENTEVPSANSFPLAANYEWSVFLSGMDRPIDLTHANDDSGRIFIAEQRGVIRIWENGELMSSPFLDIQYLIDSSGNEQGFLGFVFHPDYQLNGYFYVNYTNLNGNTTIPRFQVSADPNIADPATETIYLTVHQPYSNHNGGGMAFGLDGYLYAGIGDGGLAGDPLENGQNPDSFLGKLIRFDVDNDPVPEIWALGLRNPWRFSFDSLNGDLYLADVGQNIYEEVNFLPFSTAAGTNFGWDYFEGNHGFEDNPPESFTSVFPVAEYSHQEGGCSVTGGSVYRGELYPEWQGIYFYADYCTGYVWGLLRNNSGEWQNELLFQTDANISSFGSDEDGELYITDLNGIIFKLKRN